MKTRILSLMLILNLGMLHIANAQTEQDRNRIKNSLDAQTLSALQTKFQNQFIKNESNVANYLAKNPTIQRSFVKNGSLYYLQRIDAEGNPVYINTKNKDSGALIKADQLYTGGSLGVNITGQNMVAGIWDGGQVRATHELLSGQVAMQSGQTLDGSASNYKGNNHQTHVSGTIVGKDIANQPSARGIAFGATALNYDFDNDLTEMTTFAGGGYLISNHSYGGANDSNTPLWKFGAYDSEARDWDILLNNSPNYLPFVAVGNEQQSNGNSTKAGFDLITGAAAAKNAMTVGAVNSDKSMSDYSNWGPTDDGRVKPEIVTKGTGINSSYFADKTTNVPSDNGYSGTVNSSGTSYAAPAAAAAGLLLQQYYKSLYGVYMKAATLKALMLGTAEDLGEAGPDHKFGWGLLNVEKAAKAIKTKSTEGNPTAQSTSSAPTLTRGSYIEEITFNLPPYIQTDPNRIEINRWVIAKGGEPLIISMAWTDEKGTEQTSANGTDPTTSSLVHEYDMLVRISDPFSDTRPWKPSSLANRTAAATVQTGWFEVNNNNYKQVIITNPVAGGVYRIVIRKSATSPATLMPLSLVITGTALAAPIASNQTRCANQTVASLVATGTDIKWYAASSGGTSLATTTLLSGGTYYASQTVDGTESVRKSVSVTVNALTTPSVSISPTTVCAGATQSITTTPTNGGTATYLWKKNNVDFATTQNINITNAVANDVYTLTMTPSASVCPNPATPTATASLTITSTAAPTGSASQTVPANSTLASLTVNGTNIKWYTAGGSLLPNTTVAANGTIYYASQTLNTCESIDRLAVTVNITVSAPCPQTLTLISPNDDKATSTTTLQASETITASNKITGTANVDLRAGKSIELKPSTTGGGTTFEAAAGTVFKAYIQGCAN